MIPSRKHAAVLLAILASAAAAAYSLRAQPQSQVQPQIPQPQQYQPQRAQPQIPMPAQPPAPAVNRTLIFLDPAHGASDSGATLPDHALEKDITLALAARLRATLTAAGFTVATTRDADLPDPLLPDQRAEIANRTHAVACIVLHATATGSGVHVFASTLSPSSLDNSYSSTFVPIPWDAAQAAYVDQSLSLSGDLKSAITSAKLPVITGRAPLRPLDNLMCPAIAVEIAPLLAGGGDTTPVTDADYQQRVADALTAALRTWRTHADNTGSATSVLPEAQTAQARVIPVTGRSQKAQP